ncbi:helix-hairpin-helix domain-containing protein [Micromonospora sp. NPDC047548]|uniref:helix-hairpin-helix domain-containing protein n=1 Tax=Micromonospora sp. NPDC047548 TaxID=3155624 RepID=UPI0033C12B4B
MPSTFGQWLIVILALVLGGAGGWLWRGRQAAAAAGQPEPMMEGAPVVGLSGEEKAAATVTATVDDRTVEPVGVAQTGDEATPQVAPVTADEEPVAAESDDQVARVDGTETAERPAEVDASAAADAPVETPAAAEAEAAEPAMVTAVIPAPRDPVEDDAPAASGELVTADADVVAAPAAEAAPAGDAPADDFRRIQGVGPKMAAALQAAGIRTYRQLAELDEAALRDTIRAAGLRAAPSVATWPQQAKMLTGTDAGGVLSEPAADQI